MGCLKMFHNNINVFLILFGAVFWKEINADWHYGHEEAWPGKCTTGKYQSPVNLQKHTADFRHLSDFEFIHYEDKYPASIVNNGHSVAVRLKPTSTTPAIRGGGLPEEYKVDHLHFHWESEHTIHSNRYPLEVHIVHYAKAYNTTTDALSSQQGLAVLGVLFDVSTTSNPAIEPLIVKLLEIRREPGKAVDLLEDIVIKKFLPKNVDSFFRYEGSLTTPGCEESVIWTVFYEPVPISKSQLDYFHSIWTEDGPLRENYRHLQKLNDRVITFRSSSASKISYTLTPISIILYLFFTKLY